MDQSRAHSPSLVAQALAALISGYQAVSVGGVRRCRFVPSCSAYMKDSLLQHGVGRGLFAGLRRILKCHPWHPGGYDPVLTHGK